MAYLPTLSTPNGARQYALVLAPCPLPALSSSGVAILDNREFAASAQGEGDLTYMCLRLTCQIVDGNCNLAPGSDIESLVVQVRLLIPSLLSCYRATYSRELNRQVSGTGQRIGGAAEVSSAPFICPSSGSYECGVIFFDSSVAQNFGIRVVYV